MREIRRPVGATNDQLLRTKLIPPKGYGSLVARELLWSRLDAGLGRKLTLLSAPAGFGKTTLISQWLAVRHEPAAWLSLEPTDSDPARFWRYVVAACEVFDPAPGRFILPLLEGSQRNLVETIPSALINALVQSDSQHLLVLDDYHTITSQIVHDSLTYLINHLPTGLHLILITRHDPPLPLARLRACDNLNEFRNEDLRFSRSEIQSFFEQAIQLSLPVETIDHLERRTEGWCAGIRLFALALHGREQVDVKPFLQGLKGTHRPILDYLVTDVLLAQSEEIQAFLLQTSFLKRLTGSLCDAVTGSTISSELLEALERANVFLVSLENDNRHKWYRYHPLFAEAMQHQARHQLDETDRRTYLERASIWYEQQGFLAEAIEVALEAQAFSRAALLIEHLLADDFWNELVTLREWIEHLPDDVLQVHPEVAFAYASTILFTQRHLPLIPATLDKPLRMVEQRWNVEENQELLGRVAALRALTCMRQGDMPRAYTLANTALQLLPENIPDIWRGIALSLGSAEALAAGQLNTARRFVLEARALCEAARNHEGARAAMIVHGCICYEQGQLRQSFHLFQQILAQMPGDPQDGSTSDLGYVLWGLGIVEFEWNDLEAACHHAAEAAQIGKQTADKRLEVYATILLARIEHAYDRSEQAQHLLEAVLSIVQTPDLLWRVQFWQARLALTENNLTIFELWHARLAWRQETGLSPALIAQETLLIARMHLLEARPEMALDVLERHRAEAHAAGQMRAELETLLLMVWAYYLQDDLASTRVALSRALALAQPENIRQPFLNKGELLAAAICVVLPDIHDKRLLSFARTLLSSDSRAGTLLDHHPLSTQERRVLGLLVAGLSNREIAQELVVSINTVKTQLKSIFRKLNVSSRQEAQEAAHDFHLL